MKKTLLLFSLIWFGTSFSQEPVHFLITSHSPERISDPICSKMAIESSKELDSEIKKINARLKKKKLDINQQVYLESVQAFNAEPQKIFPSFPIIGMLHRRYNQTVDPLFYSLQKPTLKFMGPVNIEISVQNVQVSPSETALDILVSSINNPGAVPQKMHFSCPTGIMLSQNLNQNMISWLRFWESFYEEVKAADYLEKAIMTLNPSIISLNERERQIDLALNNQGITTKEQLDKNIDKGKTILSDLPFQIPFDQVIAMFVSQDEKIISCISIDTTAQTEEYYFESEYELSEYEGNLTRWLVEKKGEEWQIAKVSFDDDSLETIRNFYSSGLDAKNRFTEALWLETYNDFEDYFDYMEIGLVSPSQNEEVNKLIKSEIQPKLKAMVQEKDYPYNNFYQRISSLENLNWDDMKNYVNYQNVLISNPEKTAFIYPVLFDRKKKNSENDYYSSNEDFKFLILLKNPDNSYNLYDWHYFQPFSYWQSFSLLRCAESHLGNISNYTEDQEVLNDTDFWNNFVFKKSASGYDYLTPIIPANESIAISKAAFDAQVTDCIDLLLEHDVVDLYEHQLKSIVRCLNTIERGNLSGIQNQKLLNLCQELHFQKRLSKIQPIQGNYLPNLQLELGQPMKERSYYQIR